MPKLLDQQDGHATNIFSVGIKCERLGFSSQHKFTLMLLGVLEITSLNCLDPCKATREGNGHLGRFQSSRKVLNSRIVFTAFGLRTKKSIKLHNFIEN